MLGEMSMSTRKTHWSISCPILYVWSFHGRQNYVFERVWGRRSSATLNALSMKRALLTLNPGLCSGVMYHVYILTLV